MKNLYCVLLEDRAKWRRLCKGDVRIAGGSQPTLFDCKEGAQMLKDELNTMYSEDGCVYTVYELTACG